MFAEMKELLQQQVICCWVSILKLKRNHFNVATSFSRLHLTNDCQKKKNEISVCECQWLPFPAQHHLKVYKNKTHFCVVFLTGSDKGDKFSKEHHCRVPRLW